MTNRIIDTVYHLWNNGRKIKKSANGWLSGNAPCCHHQGHSADSRGRGGIIIEGDYKVHYSCFNCGFKASYGVGSLLGVKFKKLLAWLGADQKTVNELSILAIKIKDEYDGSSSQIQRTLIKTFEPRPLPTGSRLIRPEDKQDLQFLEKRGIDPKWYSFYVCDGEKRKRIIIPYYYDGKIVGSTSRYYDGEKPKYIADRQPGYVFNLDNQEKDWNICILVEGEFDAISIGGCAYMGNTIGDDQAQLLSSLGRKIIVVPDRDKTGLEICDRALELGWSVSIPDWSSDIKDVNDSVKKYGRLSTLLSIIESSTTNKIKIKMQRNKLV